MKTRLDIRLTEEGTCGTRAKAQNLIRSGLVYVNGKKVTKTGTMVDEADEITIRVTEMQFVGRGGYKLLKAVEVFDIDVLGLTCIDAGASTGGFTDCMLQKGAAKVFAIDVGTDQLDDSLRTDSRVVSMEQTNIRNVTPDMLGGQADFLAADVSFISLQIVLPVFTSLIKDGSRMVCLIKPQFEAGKSCVGKHGVVKDRKVHRSVIHDVLQCAVQEGLRIDGLTWSPIQGQNGNIEYLFVATKTEENSLMDSKSIERVVDEAFLHYSE